MRRQPWGLYAIAAAILVVGLVALGVPAQTLLVGALVLACPLMMLTMHGGHSGTPHTGHDRTSEHQQRDAGSTPERNHRPVQPGGPR
jgi:hypothetical protein